MTAVINKSFDFASESNEINANLRKHKNLEETVRSSSSFVNHKDNNLIFNNKSYIGNDRKIKEAKSINENLESQVDEVSRVAEYTYQKKLSDNLFDKIFGRLIQWEIFNEKQIANALNALSKMYSMNLFSFTEKKVPMKLSKLLKSSKCTEDIRFSIVKIFSSIIKNKTMRKYLLNKQVVDSLIIFLIDYKPVASNLSEAQKQ